jgi:glycerol-3-phosphate acyltransferase PlsX
VSRIALDAMGGDHAPAETVAGALAASAAGVDLVLVGDEPVLRKLLERAGADLPVHHAPDSIEMGEDPARAIREKPNSSIVACARLVRDGSASGFVSAGSTGAAMAAAAIIVGRLPGVLRPTIASVIPKPSGRTIVLDSGANPEVKPEHLVQFAEMGGVLSQVYFATGSPRVGLLNIGEERGKGRALEKEAFGILEASGVNFIGNVEGRDIGSEHVDVIVTDGFTGNVLLKTTEGAASMVARLVAEAVSAASESAQAEVLPRLHPIAEMMDYESTGGAHLLGTAGVVVIAHGSSGRKAIKNALAMAQDGADRDLVGKLSAAIAAG